MPDEPAGNAAPYPPPPPAGGPPPLAQPWASGPVAAQMSLPQQQPWSSEVYRYPLHRMAPGKSANRDKVSEFRSGEVVLAPDQVRIVGKAVSPEPTYSLLILASMFVSLIIGVILVEYVLRSPRDQFLRWDDVEKILLQPKKNRVCMIYRLPEKPKNTYALAFRLDPMLYADFEQTARRLAPSKMQPGAKILPVTPVLVWVLLLGIIVFFVALAFLGG